MAAFFVTARYTYRGGKTLYPHWDPLEIGIAGSSCLTPARHPGRPLARPHMSPAARREALAGGRGGGRATAPAG